MLITDTFLLYSKYDAFFLVLHAVECMFYILFTVCLTCVKNKRLFCANLVIITYKIYIYYKVRVHYIIYIRK